MHKIERLLQTLAPKGVEFRKLGEVLEYDQPNKYCVTSKEFDKSYPTPVLTAGKTFILGYTNEKDNIYQASKSSPVIIFDDFTTATQWVDFPFKVKSSAMKILFSKNPTINIRFIFFYMQTIPYNIGGEHTRQWISRYSQLEVPIPPLEIQQEIVKILDAFTELNTELNTELKARKKQYEYYQNMLLDFNDINQSHKDAKMSAKTYPKRLQTLLQTLAPKGVEFRKLGDMTISFTKQTGFDYSAFIKPTLIKEYLPNYIPFIQNKDFLGHYINYKTDYFIPNEIAIRFPQILLNEKCLLISISGSIGKVAVFNHSQDAFIGGAIAVLKFKEKKSLDFVMHFLMSASGQKLLLNGVKSGSHKNLTIADLKKITIPIPPLEIQQEIVKILDQFSALTTDLLAGIPAEIEARKKQYEYYREKLLAFKPLKA
ncbi:restriction endonuclease subunit S [Helicobacter pylori]|uniref:Restriction endonuclease subunit S n=1 Tax=Helicobacter pylori TaxID=210 RepID=A0AAE7ASQ3_HELPX|nr:restriction endonuclease subunit S [Helicobacter pylori]QJW29278.1 restriction endonuclease subunit S [Helicobacter pylori A45]QJW40571.1 restriction endonuclease subunit S [Helicobacter pylori]QJW42029.1 restriction endonuclease subunit S [Helicobacter pylori]QJW43485.1 restriction endonuclease subunit S [Helicobacter pylori]